MITLAIIIAIILVLMLTGFIVNTILSKGELEAIEPDGQMVDVNGHKMHVYAMGNGEKTIVLLPGLGTALPSADFGPLMRALSDQYTVVSLDYFGVGFSDQVDTPRTNTNYTEEIRAALEVAGYQPPYILMPHSVSGIYSEYYAAQYPDEVEALILLDTTTTAVEELTKSPEPPKWVYKIAQFQQSIGVIRLNTKLAPETKLTSNGYTTKEIEDYSHYAAHVINPTWIDQASRTGENIKDVSTTDFPDAIPVLKIIASDTVKSIAKQYKEDGMAYQMRHLSRLGDHASYQIVEATHFIYQTKVDEIVAMTEEFLSKH